MSEIMQETCIGPISSKVFSKQNPLYREFWITLAYLQYVHSSNHLIYIVTHTTTTHSHLVYNIHFEQQYRSAVGKDNERLNTYHKQIVAQQFNSLQLKLNRKIPINVC